VKAVDANSDFNVSLPVVFEQRFPVNAIAGGTRMYAADLEYSNIIERPSSGKNDKVLKIRQEMHCLRTTSQNRTNFNAKHVDVALALVAHRNTQDFPVRTTLGRFLLCTNAHYFKVGPKENE
jgi:hypothetical protein